MVKSDGLTVRNDGGSSGAVIHCGPQWGWTDVRLGKELTSEGEQPAKQFTEGLLGWKREENGRKG